MTNRQGIASRLAAVTLLVMTMSVAVSAATTPPPAGAQTPGRSGYVAITPCRVVDTRAGGGGAFAAGQQRNYQVAGAGSAFAGQGGRAGGCAIPANAIGVEATVTAVGPVGGGFLRAWPTGQPVPTATFLNYRSARSISNTGALTLDSSSSKGLTIRNYGGRSHYVIDVQGYFSATLLPGAGGAGYVPISPCRVVDTRSKVGAFRPNLQRTYRITGTSSTIGAQGGATLGCSIPPDASAVEATITAVSPSGDGFIRAWPSAEAMPNATYLNYARRESIGNTGAITLAASSPGGLAIRNYSATTHLVIDIQGYYSSALPHGASASYVPITPCRIVDTRSGGGGTFRSNDQRAYRATGTGSDLVGQGGRSGGCGVPATASALEASVTAVGPDADGYARLWPTGTAQPNATFLNFSRSASTTNTGAIGLSPTDPNPLTLRNASAISHYVIDIQGFYEEPLVPPATVLRNVVVIDAGDSHTCATFLLGAARCWGSGANGRLGNGSNANQLHPVTVSGLSGATAITAGTNHTCALVTAGGARCWGNGGNGQLGNGGTASSSTPVTVTGITGATRITAGSGFSCAVVGAGVVRCWGGNDYGRLGDGTTTERRTSVPVTGITGARDVSAGLHHACAALTNGQVRCWGRNTDGQLGNNTRTSSTTPVTVVGITDAVAVSVGRNHSCTLLSTGKVRCWGRNADGELGDGTTVRRPAPVAPVQLADVTWLDAGAHHTCVRVVQGTVRCWGDNAAGQLGDATTTMRTGSVGTLGTTGATRVAGGLAHSCVRLTDTTVKCWGSNEGGRLGDGSTTRRLAPTWTVTG